MRVKFKSIIDNECTEFETDVEIEKGIWKFEDNLNNVIKIFNQNGTLILERHGNVKQIFIFDEFRITDSLYADGTGLTFNLQVVTNVAKMTENMFYVNYELFLDKKRLSCHKISGKILK